MSSLRRRLFEIFIHETIEPRVATVWRGKEKQRNLFVDRFERIEKNLFVSPVKQRSSDSKGGETLSHGAITCQNGRFSRENSSEGEGRKMRESRGKCARLEDVNKGENCVESTKGEKGGAAPLKASVGETRIPTAVQMFNV